MTKMNLSSLQNIYKNHESVFNQYLALLLKWNAKINLTALKDPEKIKEELFLDSLSPLMALENVSRETSLLRERSCSLPKPLIDKTTYGTVRSVCSDGVNPILPILAHSKDLSMLDIGSGGGFPGIPLKIVMPNLHLTLAESIKKKADFLKEVVRQLQLKNVTILNQRISVEAPVGPFDVVVSRAAGPLSEIVKIGIPQMKPQGRMILLVGDEIQGEIKKVKSSQLNISIQEMAYQLEEKSRKLLIVSR